MVRVGRTEPYELADSGVFPIIAIFIGQEQDIRLLSHIDSASPEFKPGRLMEPTGEHFAFVCLSVLIVVSKINSLSSSLVFGFQCG